MNRLALACLALLVSCAVVAQAASSAERQQQARDMADRAIAYLRAQQDNETGGWAHNPGGPNIPAISGLVLTGMLMDPRVDWQDPAVIRGIDYVLTYRKDDGGIHDDFLPTYSTAICLSMLTMVPTPDAAAAVQSGLGLLRATQWGANNPGETPNPEAPSWNEPIPEEHPFYGGHGYGNNGRPDMSNTQFFMQAMHDAGVSTDDPSFARAVTFLRRVQMDDRVNEQPYAEGSRQGGFIYATVPNAESVDSFPGQSQAGEVVETLVDGSRASRLRAYGSMTYAGFKSLIYADLPRDDPRIEAAKGWIERHYTLDENPGLGDDGIYYYYLVMARALDAFGEPELRTTTPEGAVQTRRWADDMIDALADLQQADGSFAPKSARWMEDNTVLITAYALIALEVAGR